MYSSITENTRNFKTNKLFNNNNRKTSPNHIELLLDESLFANNYIKYNNTSNTNDNNLNNK